ncbi:hypothetical protein [Rickettsia tamurae]|uniref:hypothetical protein n=1 Tax=Rickettsia tamurae TaxID=334545 RepID=UPI00050A0286|nr:hypothetical protein [Rickettsia tamurae]
MTKRKFDETIGHTQITKQGKMLHDNILSEEGTLKYDFMTSLQNIVMVKIVSNLWMNQNSQQEIVNLFYSDIKLGQSGFSAKWRQIENNVVTQVSELFLANPIIKKLTNIVPLVGNSILNWIRYHDEHIFNTSEHSKYSAVDQISHITWTSRGKIDYAQTAKNILANQDSCLSNDHKYKLACACCLEDEIAIIAPNVIGPDYLNPVKLDIHPMVYFWTAHITGDNTKLYNPSYYYNYNRPNSNMSINEHIIQLLINNNGWANRTFNEVPIRYMWNKLSREEKAKNIISLVKKLGNQDLRYSLLSNLNYEQQQEVFKECSGNILVSILNDWLWKEYFLPTALHVLDIMSPLSYLYILKEINKEKIKNSQEESRYIYDQYKSIFKQLWQEGSKCSKDVIFEHENGRSLEGLVIFSLSWKRDIDIIELIFNDLNTQQKKNIIFGYNGIRHCANLIQSDQWDSLELFIKYTLSSEEDMSQLKQRMIKNKGHEIAVHFLEQEALDKIEYFMNWACKSEEEVDQLRQNFARIKCSATSESIIANNKVDFTELEHHFKWCAKGDLKVINQFKAEFPKLGSSKKLISSLIELDKYELLDQVLNWCFLNHQQQIVQFKSGMYKDDNLSCDVRSLTSTLIAKDHSFKMLDKFIGWSFTNEQEVQEFKTWMLSPQEDSCSVCTDFLIEDQFELADKVIERCITYPKEIAQFKKKLMLSDDIKVIFDGYFEEAAQDDLPLLIKWFNPSKETVAAFKNLFSETKCPNNFYKLLDKFVQNQNNLIENNEASPICDLQINLGNQNYYTEDLQEEVTVGTIGEGSVDNLDLVS